MKPHNHSNVFLGTVLLGSDGLDSMVDHYARASHAVFNTLLEACIGNIGCIIIELSKEKIFALGLCSGSLAGLVGVTPA